MTEDHDEIETLLQEVELRPQPPAGLMQAARTASFNAWQATLERRRIRRWQRSGMVGMSAAAVMLLTFVLSYYVSDDSGFQVDVAEASTIHVDGQQHGAGEITLEAGSRMVASAPARLVARKAVDLRFKAATRVNWLGSDHLYLESGSVYVDTHGKTAFHVSTREGRIRDIGTRYLVAVKADGVNLAVREGETEVETDSQTVVVRGDGVHAQVVTLGQGSLIVTDEAASSDRWAWIQEVAPDYPDVPVRELLERVCADLGKRLRFESPGVEAATVNIRMASGSLSTEDPSLALKAIVKSSGLRLVESRDEVLVGF